MADTPLNPKPERVSGKAVPPPSERAGTPPTPQAKPSITQMAFPDLSGVPLDVSHRTELVVQFQNSLSDSDITRLMVQVKAGQRDLTEALNRMSIYRKEVAQILETRRRTAAAVRKAAGSTPVGQQPIKAEGISGLNPGEAE